LNTIKSKRFDVVGFWFLVVGNGMFLNKLDFIALNPFCFRSFTDFRLMSIGVIFFLFRNFEAVSDRIPEPVPMSNIFIEDKNVGVG